MRKSETFRLTLRSCGIMYFVAILASCALHALDYLIYDMGCSPSEVFVDSLFTSFFVTGFFAGISVMFIIITRKKQWYSNHIKNNKKDKVTISDNKQSDIDNGNQSNNDEGSNDSNNDEKKIDNNLPFDTQAY